MAEERTYRGNKIKVATTQSGVETLKINNKKIDFTLDPDQGTYNSDYGYLPSNELMDLGTSIIDQQLALVKPTLTGLKNTGGA